MKRWSAFAGKGPKMKTTRYLLEVVDRKQAGRQAGGQVRYL